MTIQQHKNRVRGGRCWMAWARKLAAEDHARAVADLHEETISAGDPTHANGLDPAHGAAASSSNSPTPSRAPASVNSLSSC